MCEAQRILRGVLAGVSGTQIDDLISQLDAHILPFDDFLDGLYNETSLRGYICSHSTNSVQ